jgi:hypothetical protein
VIYEAWRQCGFGGMVDPMSGNEFS